MITTVFTGHDEEGLACFVERVYGPIDDRGYKIPSPPEDFDADGFERDMEDAMAEADSAWII